MPRPLPLPYRLLYLAGLIGGVAALAAGWCTLGATTPREPARYVEGVIGSPSRVNPLFAAEGSTDADLVALVFSGLTRIAGDGTPLPDLADRWELSADAQTYTFHLRPDVYWHDGGRFDAYDVAFTIAQVQASGFRGDPVLPARWRQIVVTARDATTVVMRLPGPSASFLTHVALGVLPEHLLDGLDAGALYDSAFNSAPAGTGPFRLVTLERRGALLERNASYYGGAPGLDEIELRVFPDPAALVAALRGGEIDAALLGERATADERLALAARPDLASTELLVAGYAVLYLNNQRDPLNDPRLRSALAAAIEVRTLLATAPDLRGVAGDGPIVPGSWAHAPGAWPGAGEAATLFEAASWLPGVDGLLARDGQPLRLELATNAGIEREALARVVASRLADHGVDVSLVVLSAAELLARRLEPRDYDLVLFGWETEVDPDPYGAWHTSQIAPPGRNVSGYHDATADALLEAARATLDTTERRALYRRFAERFVETVPSVILAYPARSYVYPAGLRGLSEGLLFTPASRFRDAHLWSLE